MSSINGLKNISATQISNTGEYRTGTNLDPGVAGQVLTSGGPDLECSWDSNAVAVPNPLSEGVTINYTSGNPSWDGSIADTINVVKVPNQLQWGKGLEDRTGNGFYDGSSGEVIDVIPHNVYYISGEYRLCWTGGDWLPNDDNSYYNVAIEDSSYSYVRGSAEIRSTSLELCSLIKIPYGWVATKYYVYCRLSNGAKYTGQTTYIYKVYNDGDATTNSVLLGSASPNGCETVITLGTTYDGTYGTSLLIRCLASSSSYYFGGGYIVIEKI